MICVQYATDLVRCDFHYVEPIESKDPLRPLRAVRAPEPERPSLRVVPERAGAS